MQRRSIRKFEPKQITDEDLDIVLECGKYAPTGMGSQSPKMVVVQNSELLDELRILNTMFWSQEKISHLKSMNASYAITKKPDPFYGAPTAVIVLADMDNDNSVYDASLVMGNLMNAAHAIGLGSCWINRAYEMFNTDAGKEYLKEWGLNDKNWRGVGICILGYPAGDYPTAKPRKPDYVMKIK